MKARKFVVAAELLTSLSEKLVCLMYKFGNLPWSKGRPYREPVHPTGPAVDERKVILGDHVTTDSGTGIVRHSAWF